MKPLVFLNAALSGLGDRLLNDVVLARLRNFDVNVYAPQIELPFDADLTPGDILAANTDAIKRSDFVLSILEKPGTGVAYELGIAIALCRPILAFRTTTGENLGKVLEGLWNTLQPECRATNLDELDEMLRRHFKGLSHAKV